MFKRICTFLLVFTLLFTLFAGIPVQVQGSMNDDKANCVAYIQTEGPWADSVYGTANIGLTGCGIVSACNALNYMYNIFDTEEKANAFIQDWAKYANSIEGFNPSTAPRSGCYRYVLYGTEISNPPPLITKYGEKYNIKMTTNWVENWNSANYYAGGYYNNIYVNQQTDLKNNLARGSTAICIVPGHFIVLAAYNPANDHFLVLDSAPSADRGTGNGVAWVSASDLSGGRPALTVGGYCVISTTTRRNPSPYQLNDTTKMIYDGESFPTMRTAFSTSLMFSNNHTQGLRSLKMLYANPTAATNKVGGFTYITLDTVTDFTDYNTFEFDLYLDKALPGSHRFQVNFCTTGEDGYNAMVTLNDLPAGWHSLSINRTGIGKAVDSADWTKVKYIRLVWWNYAQTAGATYFLIDNFRAVNKDLENAKKVTTQIEALPANVTLEHKAQVEAASTAYNALTDKGKSYVAGATFEKLNNAKTIIANLEADKVAVDNAIALLSAIPETVVYNDKETVAGAKAAYDGLRDDLKSQIPTALVEKMNTAWTAIEEMEADVAAAALVDAMIKALPTVETLTLDDQTKVEEAVAAYQGLTDAQKGYVTTYETLQALVAKLEELYFVYGDLNEDGEIDNKDYSLLQRYLNHWEVTIRLEAADLNADGLVNNVDYALLQRYLNDWDVTFGPSEETPDQPEIIPVSMDLQVMTFNVRQSGDKNADGTYSLDGTNAWHHRKTALMGYLNNSGMDILCLQEIKRVQNEEMQPLFDEKYTAIYYERDNSANPEGLTTVFNNQKFELISQNMFWLSDTPDVMSKGWGVNYYRIATEITLKEKTTGKLITVYNVQMDHQFEEARLKGVQLILDKAKNAQGQVIFAGNFNAEDTASCYGAVASEMTDCGVALDPNKVMTTFNAFGGDTEGFTKPCDFIFVKNGSTVKETRIACEKFANSDGAWRFYSDFYPVTTNVTLYWDMEAPAVDTKPVTVTVPVMTFNIRQSGDKNADGTFTLDGDNGWHNRKNAVINYINNSGMDILCLQEVKKVQSEDILPALASKYQGVYQARRSDIANPEGLMIVFNREKYEMVNAKYFYLSETPEKQSYGWGANYYRICLVVTLRHKTTGELLNVFNVHLDHQVEAARTNGLKLVMEQVKTLKGHSVVAGDFNTEASSGCYSIVANEMTACQSIASSLGITYQGWGQEDDGFTTPIDFIFTDKQNTKVKSYEICKDMWKNANGVSCYYSDHYAVKSTLELTY